MGEFKNNKTEWHNTQKVGDAYEKPSDPTQSGKTFKGWSNVEGGPDIFDFVNNKVSEDNNKFWAIWENSVNIIISWNPKGGKFDWNNSQEVQTTEEIEGDAIQSIETKNGYLAGWGITKEGYTFKGWSTNPNATEPDSSLGIADEEKTFYAIWDITKYDSAKISGKPIVLFDKDSSSTQQPLWQTKNIPIDVAFTPNPYTAEDDVTYTCTPKGYSTIIQDQRSGESYALPDIAGTSITRTQKGNLDLYLGYFWLYNGSANTGNVHFVKTHDSYNGSNLIIKDDINVGQVDNGDGTITFCLYAKNQTGITSKLSESSVTILNGTKVYNTDGIEKVNIPSGYIKLHIDGNTYYNECTISKTNGSNGDTFVVITENYHTT